MKDVAYPRHRWAAKRTALVFLWAIAILGVMAGSGEAAPGDTTRVSVSSSGSEGNSASGGWSSPASRPSISEDGRYVAFESDASNLVADDTNSKKDVFVHDRQTGTTERVSADSSGGEHPSISADGRYVAFESVGQVVVRDRQTETTELVSVNYYDGTEARFGGLQPSISADGRYVAFTSRSDDLVENDSYSCCDDVFVRDLQAGRTERVSVNSSGDAGNHHSFEPSISADGRYVAFGSTAWNLVENDNTLLDVFVRDRQEGTTELVSVSSSGIQGDESSFEHSISADGRYVAFVSFATNLGANDANEPNYLPYYHYDDVFVRDRQEGTTELVNVSSSESEGNDPSVGASISGDGRYVTFESGADNLVANDTNDTSDTDIFVRNRQEGTTERVSVDGSGNQGNGESFHPSISADGRYVAFDSRADNLVANDTNGFADVFMHERNVAPPPPPPPPITDPLTAFAPLVYLHGKENYWPTSATPFILNSSLRWSHQDCPDHSVVKNGYDLDLTRLGNGGYSHQRRSLASCAHAAARYTTADHTRPYDDRPNRALNNFVREGFYLDPDDSWAKGQPDLLPQPVYYDYRPESHYIAYWFFYPYNAKSVQKHEGDWEHVSVRLNCSNEEVRQVDYYNHGDADVKDWSELDWEGTTHPVVFSAKGSHASYPEARNDWPTNVPEIDDKTNYGHRWDTSANLVDVRAQPWYGFGGAWGEVGDGVAGQWGGEFTGPLGPSSYKENVPAGWNDTCLQ